MGDKKTLLEENTVRSFMKLANLDTNLSSNFLSENYTEDLTEVHEDDMDAPVGDDMDIPVGDDMDIEPEAEMEADPALQQAVEDAIVKFVEAGMDAAGVEGEVVPGEEEMPGDEGPEELDDLGEPPGLEDMEGEEVLDEINVVDTEGVVQETLRRVTKRLAGMNREEKLIERIANKVQSKLHSKR